MRKLQALWSRRWTNPSCRGRWDRGLPLRFLLLLHIIPALQSIKQSNKLVYCIVSGNSKIPVESEFDSARSKEEIRTQDVEPNHTYPSSRISLRQETRKRVRKGFRVLYLTVVTRLRRGIARRWPIDSRPCSFEHSGHIQSAYIDLFIR